MASESDRDAAGTCRWHGGWRPGARRGVRTRPPARARLVLVDVVPPTPLWMYGDVGYGPVMYIDPAWDEEALRRTQIYVEGLSRQLQSSGLRVDAQALRGDVAP